MKVNKYVLEIKNLPPQFKDFRIVLFGDVHRSKIVSTGYIRKCISKVNNLNPDIVLNTGDYVTGKQEYIFDIVEILKTMKPEYGVYSVLGNHDGETIAKGLKQAGIKVLRNESATIEKEGGLLRLIGLDDSLTGYENIVKILKDTKKKEVRLLMTHNPDLFEILKLYEYKIDLIAAGHTHGGQVVIPFIGPPLVPSIYGKKYASGFIREKNGLMYVTRGIGTYLLPVRFFCRPEITLFILSEAKIADSGRLNL
ncbi:metallophosphoesterase [bacterium]|nr:metallophosphoesterase [bacterium]